MNVNVRHNDKHKNGIDIADPTDPTDLAIFESLYSSLFKVTLKTGVGIITICIIYIICDTTICRKWCIITHYI